MKTDEVLRMLGLTYRAGKVVWGYQAVMAAILKGKVFMLLLTTDCSPHLRNKMLSICRQGGIMSIVLGSKVALGKALGKPPCAVVGITDNELAKVIRQKAQGVDA